MSLFSQPVTPAAQTETTLTVNQKNEIVDRLANNENITAIKHAMFIPDYVIKKSIQKLFDIKHYMEKYMSGLIVVEPAVYGLNEESGFYEVTTPDVYNTKPTLKGDFENVIKAAFPDCSVTALEYFINKVIVTSTDTGTWTTYKEKFND
jgi:hypothetical protein